MEKLFLVCISDYYYKNKIFNIDSPTNRDDYYYPYYLLKKKFNELGVSLNTYDYFNENNKKAYGLLFFDIPKNVEKYFNDDHESYLVISESTIVHPINWKIELHKHFKKIFTWNDDFVKG
ncbi:MAG: hypothetical protein EMLJLAPB_00191 [Candidatus Argoarchaeum ethanivorans]|uniref:Uncharacterized protein n=1 Tax=Candidatus Argoarchaeum ethanivorans TaxID=2608793 RepID=A0A811T454_9EURY|nr:MAG: hypothetical protein EMLJLAPB_00191 [Candidatus Argoarchaeum ethanivorans]